MEKNALGPKASSSLKKRLAKEEEKKLAADTKVKREQELATLSSKDFPLRINLMKCLAEERRQVILDFANAKLSGSKYHGHEIDSRILNFLIQKDQNVGQYLFVKGDKDTIITPGLTWKSIQSDYQGKEAKSPSEKDIQ